MSVTILALVFIILILLVAALGFKMMMKPGTPPGDTPKERCSLCRISYDKSSLIERQVGDTRLFFFCRSCVEQLHNDFMRRISSEAPGGMTG